MKTPPPSPKLCFLSFWLSGGPGTAPRPESGHMRSRAGALHRLPGTVTERWLMFTPTCVAHTSTSLGRKTTVTSNPIHRPPLPVGPASQHPCLDTHYRAVTSHFSPRLTSSSMVLRPLEPCRSSRKGNKLPTRGHEGQFCRWSPKPETHLAA